MPEYFDGGDGRELEIPWLKWPLIVSGVIIFIVGVDVWTHNNNFSRGVSWMATGFGMAFYGLIVVFMRNSPWKWFAIVIALTAWFGGLFVVLQIVLEQSQ